MGTGAGLILRIPDTSGLELPREAAPLLFRFAHPRAQLVADDRHLAEEPRVFGVEMFDAPRAAEAGENPSATLPDDPFAGLPSF